MRDLFKSWDEVARRLEPASKIALFLDFDGTLARLRPTPDEVILQTSLRRSLSVLARNPRFLVWVISGRRRSDIRARIRVPGIRYLGLHGWEGRNDMPVSESAHLALEGVKSWAGGLFASTPEVWIEDKGHSLAIHHRQPFLHNGQGVDELVEKVVEPFSHLLRMARAKNVSEVLPLELEDKGAAVKQQMGTECSSAVPIYIGDDLIDEPAFAELRRGVTILVGRARLTKAQYRVSDVKEVQKFLDRLGRGLA